MSGQKLYKVQNIISEAFVEKKIQILMIYEKFLEISIH